MPHVFKKRQGRGTVCAVLHYSTISLWKNMTYSHFTSN